MRVGEAASAEVRHRVGLAPNDVVQHPETKFLQDCADAEDVVIAADHPDGAVLAQQPAALGQPFAGEGVVGGEVVEAVPVVVDAIDQAVVGPPQLAAQLQVVRRVGEDAMHRGRRQHTHHARRIAQQNLIERQFADDLQVLRSKRLAAAAVGMVVGHRRPVNQTCNQTWRAPYRWCSRRS